MNVSSPFSVASDSSRFSLGVTVGKSTRFNNVTQFRGEK